MQRKQHDRKQHRRVFAFVASAAVVTIAAALVAVGATSATSAAASRVINVSGVITAFTPSTINVTAGEQVSICLVSPDTDHDLTIPTVDNFQVVAPTGPAVCKTLTAPDKAGTHRFICSIPGHEQAGMVGSLVVAEAGSAVTAEPSVDETPGGQAPAAGAQTPVVPSTGLSLNPLTVAGALLVVAMLSALLGYRVGHKGVVRED